MGCAGLDGKGGEWMGACAPLIENDGKGQMQPRFRPRFSMSYALLKTITSHIKE